MANNQVTVKVECSTCGGTGIYHGFAEPEGVGVVCLTCVGTGEAELKYTPFTGRKECMNIHTIRQSRGTHIATGVGPTGASVTYKEFLAGKLP